MTLHFILGGNMTEDQWAGLGVAISNFYKPRIGGNFDITYYRYTDDTFSIIQKNYPTGPLFLLGHSFGGCRVAQVSAQFAAVGRVVDHAMMFDPVEITAWNVQNTKGFAMPNNVAEAVCFYRGATEPPFSGQITSGPNYRNILLPPSGGGSANFHGSAVWDGQALGLVGQVIKGGTMLPPVSVVANPTTVVTPTQPAGKTLASVTLTFVDGTTQVIKVN